MSLPLLRLLPAGLLPVVPLAKLRRRLLPAAIRTTVSLAGPYGERFAFEQDCFDSSAVFANVAARLQAVAPALAALELSALVTGSAPRSAGELLHPDDIVRCTVAKHSGFGEDFTSLSMPQLRRLQRGHRAARAFGPPQADEALHRLVFGLRAPSCG